MRVVFVGLFISLPNLRPDWCVGSASSVTQQARLRMSEMLDLKVENELNRTSGKLDFAG